MIVFFYKHPTIRFVLQVVGFTFNIGGIFTVSFKFMVYLYVFYKEKIKLQIVITVICIYIVFSSSNYST